MNKDKICGFDIESVGINCYWSSTEYDKEDAWHQDFDFGDQDYHIKYTDTKILNFHVSAVKSL